MSTSNNKIIKDARLNRQAFVVPPEGKPGQVEAAQTLGHPEGQEAQELRDGTGLNQTLSQDAQALLEQAAEEARLLRAAAQEEGYQEGLRSAREETAEELQRLWEMANQARVDLQQLLHNVEREAVDLVLLISRKVVHCELSVNPSAIEQVVRHALDMAEKDARARIRVHQEDLNALGSQWEEIFGHDPSFSKVELVADNFVQRGGCIIDANGKSFDAQSGFFLAEIERAFHERMGGMA